MIKKLAALFLPVFLFALPPPASAQLPAWPEGVEMLPGAEYFYCATLEGPQELAQHDLVSWTASLEPILEEELLQQAGRAFSEVLRYKFGLEVAPEELEISICEAVPLAPVVWPPGQEFPSGARYFYYIAAIGPEEIMEHELVVWTASLEPILEEELRLQAGRAISDALQRKFGVEIAPEEIELLVKEAVLE